jgi:cold shock CspA family protein
MGRSQETFSKKEREKKKRLKQQNKDMKREARKSNNDKGKGLDAMMAFIDENGNLTSTPPDPKKKKQFLVEDIQISVAKHAKEDPIRSGVIICFYENKGYGFIQDKESGERIFLHVKQMQTPMVENDKVLFEVESGQKGLSAVRVKKAV